MSKSELLLVSRAKRRPVTVYMTTENHETLKAMAEEEKRSVSLIVDEIISAYLKRKKVK